MSRTARLFVISGPSGVGKGTLVSRLRATRSHLGLTVSATTRQPRPGEIEGQSYYFLTDEEFNRRIAAGEFLEWADVHSHKYGTLVSEVEKNLQAGDSVILEIDVQGALNVRKVYPDAVLIFIEPPSLEALEARLRGRQTEDNAAIALRMADARGEMQWADRYDTRLVNDDLVSATAALSATIDSYEMK